MKTIGDIAALLKRNESCKLSASVDSRGVFTVEFLGYRQTSKRLDDALEHVVEEMRRNASGVGAMRDGKGIFTEVQSAPLASLQQAVQAIKNHSYTGSVIVTSAPVPSQVTAACGTVTAAGGTCPKCNSLPHGSFGGVWQCYLCKHNWGQVQTGRNITRKSDGLHYYDVSSSGHWLEIPAP